jgi:hypothetical protein
MFRSAHCRVDSKLAHVFDEDDTSDKKTLKERMTFGLTASDIQQMSFAYTNTIHESPHRTEITNQQLTKNKS